LTDSLAGSPAAGAADRGGARPASLLIALAAACLVLAIGAAPASAALPPLQTGVSYVLSSEEPVVALEHVTQTGAQLVQTPVRWSEVAPTNQPASWQPEDPGDPHYDWDRTDRWVVAAVRDGLTPVLQIRSAPSWVQRCPPALISGGAPCNPDPAALAAFATAAARRYSGQFGGLPRVQYWQGMNEPNLSLFFNPQFDENGKPVSPFLYRALINSFYAAVKAVDPSNLVIAAGLGPIAVPGFTIGPMRFARLLLCMTGGNEHPRPTKGNCEGGVDFDIFDIHPYTSGGPTHEGGVNDVEMGDLHKLTTLLAAADRAGRIHGAFPHTPLWITEFSWDSNPPDPGGLQMKILTRWAAEALHDAWSAGVHTFFWYSLRDAPGVPGYPNAETPQTGLYFRGATVAQDEPKEVLSAFRFPFVAYPRTKGLEFWGRTPTSSSGKVSIQALKGGHWRGVFVARADENGIFRGKAATLYGRDERGKVRAVYRGQGSPPFSMHNVPDFPQPPFGTE
jgi:hypothetical protein